jgi:oxygen-independent coproporphyrinogen-3 oxidase
MLRPALGRALALVGGRSLVSVLIDAAGAPPAGAVHTLLADLARQLEIAPDLEASLAIDPLTAQGLAAYRAAGINRLALRARMLDRKAQALLANAAQLFPRCALDLTFGRPRQSLVRWRQELDRALELGVGHISLEEHTLASSDLAAGFYRVAQDRLGAAGLQPYEIAHFARPGQESRQLLHGATGGDYLGIGPGAVGRITVGGVCHAFSQIAPPAAWLRAVETGEESHAEVLGAEQRRTELLLTGIRLCVGVERAWFEPLAGAPLEAVLDSGRLAPLIDDGFVLLDRRGLRLTDRGWLLCDAVLDRLLA